MRFLYGDSTPFPLETNFIETLKAVVDAAAARLKVDQVLERGREVSSAAQAEAEREAMRLDQMAIALASALEPGMGAQPPQARVIASRVIEAAQGVLEAGRGEISQRRELALRDATSQA